MLRAADTGRLMVPAPPLPGRTPLTIGPANAYPMGGSGSAADEAPSLQRSPRSAGSKPRQTRGLLLLVSERLGVRTDVQPWAPDPRALSHAVDVASPPTDTAVVLFDGVCNVCNDSVLFIIDRDPRGRFRFAPLQSHFAQELLGSLGEVVAGEGVDSMVLVEGSRAYLRSDAALRIAKGLRSPWPVLGVLLAVPRPIRDLVYDLIARNRYRWFGREEVCRVPTPELRERFVD